MTDLEAAAEKAPLTRQIRSLLAWLGEGRKLTQTGRIGLADARYLVELLGTSDQIDPEIGGRIFKTKSSEELTQLTGIVEWAKATRLVRVTGAKLVPVKKNAALADRPLDLVLAMLAAYPKLGKTLFPRNTWRNSLVGDEFADVSHELLTALLAGPGACRLATLSGIASDMIEARYVLSELTRQQHDSLQRMIAVDVTIASGGNLMIPRFVPSGSIQRSNTNCLTGSPLAQDWPGRNSPSCERASRNVVVNPRRPPR
jgi:hypothetical protein